MAKSYQDLVQENKKALELLAIALSHGVHAQECPYNEDEDEDCTCWAVQTRDFLELAKEVDTQPKPEVLVGTRSGGNVCECGHPEAMHTVNFGTTKGCSKVGCSNCDEFRDTGKEATSHW